MILRPYQQRLKDNILKIWASGKKNAMAVLPTGGGKGYMIGDILRDEQGPSIAIAHRQELVGQISMALARQEVYHRIIGPNDVVKFCSAQHLIELNKSFVAQQSKVTVAGVDTVIARAPELANWARSIQMLVIDECFPAGTLVDGRLIETIKVGDFVKCFDENTGEIHTRKVNMVFKNPAPKNMVRLTIGHHVLNCTENHPIFTTEGWKHAKDITTGLEVYMVWEPDTVTSDIGSELPLQNQGSNILSQNKMWKDVHGGTEQYFEGETCEETSKIKCCKGEGEEGKSNENRGGTLGRLDRQGTKNDHTSTCSDKGMCMVRKNLRHGEPSQTTVREILLFNGLFKIVSFKEKLRNNDFDKQMVLTNELQKNERKESDVQTGDKGRGFEETERDRALSKINGWKRKICNKGRDCLEQCIFFFGISKPMYCKDWYTESKIQNSLPLQSRLWELQVEDRDRSGWFESPDKIETRTGWEKGCLLQRDRVDHVEILQSSDIGRNGECLPDGYVYNIEVDEFHTYFANSIAVHNCHHLTKGNKWGQAIEMFPNARGLGVTATPCRADGKGLGRNASGVIDEMTVGPTMRDLITQGFLSDYRIFAPPSDLDLHDVEIGSTGDFKAPQLKKAVQKSHITGDVVEHYLKIAPGKLGVTFATDVETATEISHAFNARGVVSAVVSAKTPAANRVEIVRRFRNREIMQLVNVDLFGEGFDLPAIEVVSMVRPTQSYGLYCQQFGRALRPLPGKSHAIIIDHVGNVVRHGLPDAPRKWTLEDRSKRSTSTDTGIPCRTCPSCTGVYERVHRCCPYCGFYPTPAERSGPDFVDGDLEELTPETLARLRGGVIDLDTPLSTIAQSYMNQGLPPYIAQINAGRFGKTQEAQRQLREAIGWYGAWARLRGEPDNESQRRFYLKYGVDIISAQALKESDAMELRERVLGDL